MQRSALASTHKSFSSCHDIVDPISFIVMCQEDVCSYLNYTSLNNSFCDAFTQYSRACARNDIELSWREELNICCKYNIVPN